MDKLYMVILLLIIIPILICIKYARKVKSDVADSITRCLFFVTITIISNIVFAFSQYQLVAYFMESVYLFFFDLVLIYILQYSQQYTRVFHEVSAFRIGCFIVAYLDGISLLLNTFFHHVFTLKKVSYIGIQMYCVSSKTIFYDLHYVFVYCLMFCAIASFLTKIMRISSFYRTKYIPIFVVLCVIMALNMACNVSGFPLDLSLPITVGIVLFTLPPLPAVFGRIFAEAFGLRQAVAGGFGAVMMNGAKRGLFSNEAGSGSAPCAAAAAECDDPVKMGFVQALGVLIDTVVICSCTAFLMLLVPQELTAGLAGMDLLQKAMQYHLGSFGVVFIAVTLALFSFSTFIGILYYARCNVAYLFGDSWFWQTAYKVLALVMLVVGGMQAYTVVWDLGDVGIGLMTIFNMLALYPLSGEALTALREYEAKKKLK